MKCISCEYFFASNQLDDFVITSCSGFLDSNILWNVRKMEAWNSIAGILHSNATLCNIFIAQWFSSLGLTSKFLRSIAMALTIFRLANLETIISYKDVVICTREVITTSSGKRSYL